MTNTNCMGCWHRWVITAVILACFITLPVPGILSGRADARADFATVANRNTKLDLPLSYDYNNSSWRQILTWPGTGGIGNLGIGNGSTTSLSSGTTTGETMLPENYAAGAVSVDCAPASVEMYYPSGRRFPDLLNEYPAQCTTIYGKLVGLQVAGGHVVNMAIRSLGAQYASKTCPEGGCPRCDLNKARS